MSVGRHSQRQRARGRQRGTATRNSQGLTPSSPRRACPGLTARQPDYRSLMTLDVSAVVEQIETAVASRPELSALPLTDEAVRGQGFAFSPAYWRKRWPTTTTDMPPVVAEGRARVPVTRQDVFARFTELRTPDDVLEAYVWMCGWGAGTKARPLVRCLKPLAHDRAAADPPRLGHVTGPTLCMLLARVAQPSLYPPTRADDEEPLTQSAGQTLRAGAAAACSCVVERALRSSRG